MTKYKKGDELICVTTTRADGTIHKCFYVYDTEASWASRDSAGKLLPHVTVKREQWDGVSYIITGNGD